MTALASYRSPSCPGRPRARRWRHGGSPSSPRSDAPHPGYEDWYLVNDHAALGVLNEAAAGRGHRSSHDDVATQSGRGAGGLYALLEGEPTHLARRRRVAVWVAIQPVGSGAAAVGRVPGLAGLLGDGMDGATASLWRRQLVLGPAPELCVVAPEAPSGVREGRLPRGWSARVLARELLWSL